MRAQNASDQNLLITYLVTSGRRDLSKGIVFGELTLCMIAVYIVEY